VYEQGKGRSSRRVEKGRERMLNETIAERFICIIKRKGVGKRESVCVCVCVRERETKRNNIK
jgi:hypothetical protein